MTDILDPQTVAADPTTTASPRQRAEAWLTDFDAALRARDVDTAAGLFATSSFWRDLVSFTWNLRTVEGHDGIRDLLQHTLDAADPTDWTLSEEPAEAGGVIECWITDRKSVV